MFAAMLFWRNLNWLYPLACTRAQLEFPAAFQGF